MLPVDFASDFYGWAQDYNRTGSTIDHRYDNDSPLQTQNKSSIQYGPSLYTLIPRL